MTLTPQLSTALRNARVGNDQVMKDLQSRKDYSKKPELQKAVKALMLYHQSLQNAEAQATLTGQKKSELQSESSNVSQDVLAPIIDDNIQMMNMGQLNTSRTIEPSVAKANNQTMDAQQQNISALIAQLAIQPAPPIPEPRPEPTPKPAPEPHPGVEPVLQSLRVTGAERLGSGLNYQFWNDSQFVRIQAVTDPDTPEAWAQVQWTGGARDSSGLANFRQVPLNHLTRPGAPAVVTASLRGRKLSEQVAVVPNLLSLEVEGATNEGEGTWTAAGSNPVTVRAAVSPDSKSAYPFISWTGGKADSSAANNVRLVDFPKDSSGTDELPVSAAIKVS